MATLALSDVEPDLLDELDRRARQLGTTVEREALRALRDHLAGSAPSLDLLRSAALPGAAAPPDETRDAAPRVGRLTGRDFVRLLRSAPRPDDAYLDAVEEAVRNQPTLPELSQDSSPAHTRW